MKEDKEIIKGEIGNVCGYPAFELIIQGELKQVVTLDDVQKILDKQRQEIIEIIKECKIDVGTRDPQVKKAILLVMDAFKSYMVLKIKKKYEETIV